MLTDRMLTTTAPFRLERDMLAPLARALPSVLGLPSDDTVRTLREPDLGLVIPDVLVGVWRGPGPAKRSRCTLVEAFLVAWLESGGSWTPDELDAALYLAAGEAARLLVRLRRAGVAAPNRLGRWRLAPDAHSRHADVIAIEAKLRRWREALAQGTEYREFADRSYVVLDGNQVAGGEPMLGAFRAAGVGLLFQYGHVLVPVLEARAARPRSERRIRAVDKLFDRSRTPTA